MERTALEGTYHDALAACSRWITSMMDELQYNVGQKNGVVCEGGALASLP